MVEKYISAFETKIYIPLTNNNTVVEFISLHRKRRCGKDVYTGQCRMKG
jgi:hypothetical protein